MINLEKQEAVNQLTSFAVEDREVSAAIKEIAEKIGLDEEVVLKAFVSLEVEKELVAQNKVNEVKKTIRE